jgi:uridine kinase
VEGILVLSEPTLREHFDLSIFVDTSDEVRLQRRITRDVAERGRTEVQVREQVAKTVQIMHNKFVQPSVEHAKLIVSGERPLQILIDEILSQASIKRILHL